MSEVVPIRANIAPDSGTEALPEVVEKLIELLEMAKAGEVRGIAFAILCRGDLSAYGTAGRTTRGALGALVMLQHDMCKADLEEKI